MVNVLSTTSVCVHTKVQILGIDNEQDAHFLNPGSLVRNTR